MDRSTFFLKTFPSKPPADDSPRFESPNPMQIAILGAGAIAYANAALLCKDGHDVILWSPSGQRTEKLAAGAPLIATGAVVGRFHPRIATSCAAALADAEAVLVAVPGYGHRRVLDTAAPHLRSEQTVVFSSHMSLAALGPHHVDRHILGDRQHARAATDLFPSVGRVRIVRTWTGIEAKTDDHLPVIGASPNANGCYHAFGFSGHGFQLVPVVGAILTDLIIRGATRRLIDGLGAERLMKPRATTPTQATDLPTHNSVDIQE